ncbi:MAG TPA: hypothetical protein VN456_10095 [Desulfosporosinus sp.]|nr:hypothetical protein [Desulfosporosinus sp.]
MDNRELAFDRAELSKDDGAEHHAACIGEIDRACMPGVGTEIVA